MRRFAQQTELLIHARDHVENRVNSLEKDVRHCLQGELAPFPAILYCFSTIDLLGALVSGRADKKAPTTQQSIHYMTSFMSYTTENADLLLNLFRHKLVHLAQPDPVIRRDSELITWRYHHNDRQFHLRKILLTQVRQIQVTSVWKVEATHEFHISIMDLVKDIKDSTARPNGYLDLLEKTPHLQDKYETVIDQIYVE